MSRATMLAPAGALIALVLAGCSAGEPGQPTAPPASDPTSAASPAPPTPTAADGRDYAACADGNCEVLVLGPVEIPLTGQGGITKLSVRGVGADGIDFTTEGDGTGSGSLDPGCVSTFYSGGGGPMCSTGEPEAPEPVDGVLAMQIVDLREGTAILRLVAGKPGPPPTSLVPPVPTFAMPTFNW